MFEWMEVKEDMTIGSLNQLLSALARERKSGVL